MRAQSVMLSPRSSLLYNISKGHDLFTIPLKTPYVVMYYAEEP